MDLVTGTIRARFQGPVCRIQLCSEDGSNKIGAELIADLWQVLERCDDAVTVVVLEGSPEVFCSGADFTKLNDPGTATGARVPSAEPLYDLWHLLAHGPWISVAHVRGRVNAGGVGFVSCCDVVLAENGAEFSLSELLFGLVPACVLPFLIRRIGFQRAHYLTLTTRPVAAAQACEWGLVDACEADSESLLRRHLLRFRRVSKASIVRYKKYLRQIESSLERLKPAALSVNTEMFADQSTIAGIRRFVESGAFPWEGV